MPTLPFPPLGGVGVRRKVKVAKYLARAGIEVDVVTVRNAQQTDSYENDTVADNIVIRRLASLSLHNLTRAELKTWAAKAARRALFYLTSPVYFIDDATLWGLVLVPFTRRYLADTGITKIYCSGPPFSTCWHMSLVKRRLGDRVTLISEWRDVWVEDAYRHYPFPAVLFKWLNERIERSTLELSDAVITVTPRLGELLAAKLGDPAKVHVIENGYDPDEFPEESPRPEPKRAPGRPRTGIRIGYAGEIGGTRLDGLLLVLDAVRSLMRQGTPVTLELMGELGRRRRLIEGRYPDLIRQRALVVHGLGTPAQAAALIRRVDYAVVLVQTEHPEALTTKFFDYSAARKTLIGVGPPGGDLEQRIEQSELGLYVAVRDPNAAARIADFVGAGTKTPPERFEEIRHENTYPRIAERIWALFGAISEQRAARVDRMRAS